MLLNIMGFDALVTSTYFNRVFRKSNICMHFVNFKQNSSSVKQSKMDPLFLNMCNTVLVLIFSRSGVCPV